ncbi:DUF167 domain-containing protein [Neorhodopirellula pilleata]|uniref:UPF0235 protein Pla100_00900 n=1 Tax=Neorhodopirellula pilleata TaxID=2714738 RepID=A0A5C6AVU1_9BACT|nr:DUF167 domain-containing protein [Neorhodopirellula pilleata]TWU03172.1 hypothetical protein Pla100_00900 [Neorhodopirellula pilleata]
MSDVSFLSSYGPDAVLKVHATPGAKRESVGGVHDGALRVCVTAPADKGRANEAIIKAIAKSLCLKPRQIELTSGLTSRRKAFRIVDAPSDLSERLSQLLNPKP